MKCCLLLVWSAVVLLSAVSPAFADPAEKSDAAKKSASPKYCAYAATPQDAEWTPALLKLLRGKGDPVEPVSAKTIDAAIASNAEVLLIVSSGLSRIKASDEEIELLKKQRIVGIGYGASELFGRMGLEINNGACAQGTTEPVTLSIEKSGPLGEPKDAKPLRLMTDEAENNSEVARLDHMGMFLPRLSPQTKFVDAIARWRSDPNYAPIVRQGNFIFIGMPVPPEAWAPAYTEFFQRMCLALSKRKREEFATARWEITKPGNYDFKLAEGHSTDKLTDKTFYFQFEEPTDFRATLELKGSKAVMLMFLGQHGELVTREDSNESRPPANELEIAKSITLRDIVLLDDGYWMLKVSNFDNETAADCKLTIEYETLEAK